MNEENNKEIERKMKKKLQKVNGREGFERRNGERKRKKINEERVVK